MSSKVCFFLSTHFGQGSAAAADREVGGWWTKVMRLWLFCCGDTRCTYCMLTLCSKQEDESLVALHIYWGGGTRCAGTRRWVMFWAHKSSFLKGTCPPKNVVNGNIVGIIYTLELCSNAVAIPIFPPSDLNCPPRYQNGPLHLEVRTLGNFSSGLPLITHSPTTLGVKNCFPL